jgi:hypothetical protein
MTSKDDEKISEYEIAKRRDDAIRRALSMPPSPLKKLLGKTERAQNMREMKRLRGHLAKPKKGEAS